MCKLGVISQERLTLEVKIIYASQLAQQRMTLNDIEGRRAVSHHPHRALSLLLVYQPSDLRRRPTMYSVVSVCLSVYN